MAFTPPLSPLVFLAFLGTGAVLFLAGVAVVVLLLLRRFELARKILLGALVWAGAYAGVLLGFSLASSEKILAVGEWKYFCEVDCHLAYSVVDVTTTKTFGPPSNRKTAQGMFYVITVKTWFDEKTISTHRAKDLPLRPNRRAVAVVDDQGRRYRPSIEGQLALAQSERPSVPLTQSLRAGESYSTVFVFDLPANSRHPRLLVATTDEIAWFVIGHESSFFHKKILFRLEPRTAT
ncbi:MAG: hypothetical protein V3R29_03655 [Candidatus Acidoferrales bacterium]